MGWVGNRKTLDPPPETLLTSFPDDAYGMGPKYPKTLPKTRVKITP